MFIVFQGNHLKAQLHQDQYNKLTLLAFNNIDCNNIIIYVKALKKELFEVMNLENINMQIQLYHLFNIYTINNKKQTKKI